MLSPIRVAEIELTRPVCSLKGLQGYLAVQALIRWHGIPIGWVRAPVENGEVAAPALKHRILEQLQWPLVQAALQEAVRAGRVGSSVAAMLRQPATLPSTLPSVTVAVCTRDRPADLARCLDAIGKLNMPVDVLVIDNAPSTDATERLVKQRNATPGSAPVRYVREPRPGLDWARNRAVLEAKGEIIAFTDDDVIVDPDWAASLARVFAENPQV